MVFSRSLSALVARSLPCFAAVSLAFACARGTSGANTEMAAPAKAKRIGFFAFDGTGANASHNDIIYKMYTDAKASEKRYYEGTDLLATTFNANFERSIAEICALHKAKPFDEVALVGYSRGAGAALWAATRLPRECGSSLRVRWIGLADAVVTAVEKTLEDSNAGRDLINMRCFHVGKSHESIPIILDTARVLSCAKKIVQTDHLGIAKSDEAASLLREDALTVMPGLFPTKGQAESPAASASTGASARSEVTPGSAGGGQQTPAPDQSPISTRASDLGGPIRSTSPAPYKPDGTLASCRQFDLPASCLQARCSWGNGRCDPQL